MRTLTIGDRTISYDTGLNYVSSPLSSSGIFKKCFFFYLEIAPPSSPLSDSLQFTPKTQNGIIIIITNVFTVNNLN